MSMQAGTKAHFLIVMSALVGVMQLNCVKRDLPLGEIVGTYSTPRDYVGTSVVLNPDHTFVWANWTCGGTNVVKGRWEQVGNGLLAISRMPAPPKDPGGSAKEADEVKDGEGLDDICAIDPTACPIIRLDLVRMRPLGDSLELMMSPDEDDPQKLPRVR